MLRRERASCTRVASRRVRLGRGQAVDRCEPRLVALEAVLILPILDGLDEVPEAARPLAVTQISNEHRPGGQVVVSCRTERYQAMVSRQDG